MIPSIPQPATSGSVAPDLDLARAALKGGPCLLHDGRWGSRDLAAFRRLAEMGECALQTVRRKDAWVATALLGNGFDLPAETVAAIWQNPCRVAVGVEEIDPTNFQRLARIAFDAGVVRYAPSDADDVEFAVLAALKAAEVRGIDMDATVERVRPVWLALMAYRLASKVAWGAPEEEGDDPASVPGAYAFGGSW